VEPDLTPSRRVRLLVVNPSPVRGGAEELLLALATRARTTDVEVACLAGGPFVDELEAAGARVRRVRAGRLRNLARWARTVARLARLARQADAVLSWQVKGHYYGTPAAWLARRPSAWWDHGIRPARGEPRYLIDNRLPALLRSRTVVCSSAAAASRHRRGRAILPGIDLARYERSGRAAARTLLGADGDEVLVGSVARLQPWKGQHLLIEAMPAILQAEPRARLVVVGGTPGGFSAGYPARLERLARELGIEDRVRFFGQRDDVPALLPGLDVFVAASFAEPFGLTTVEAMAAGVPVVATDAGGVPEIVVDEESGLLAPAGDAAAIARAVIRILTEDGLGARLATAGRDRARHDFDISRYVRETEALVRALAGGA